MALGAIARGYDYMAITDHSHRLREGRLAAQDGEVAALNERLAPFRILRGVEVNIRADGAIDLTDDELATRDWVVASLHTSFDKNPTERILAAMESPYVDCIGHPTTRKINKRAPAELDLERVIQKALETGTFLEINGQPDRLDLRDSNARAAGEAGLKLLVSSDGHSVAALSYLDLAVSQARRAWLTKEQVLNTRTWAQVARLRKKRRDLP
jgi:DNA polymerase (family 10)